MKKFLSLCLVLCLALSLATPVLAEAALAQAPLTDEVPPVVTEPASLAVGKGESPLAGGCGATAADDVKWQLTQNDMDADESTYTLTISGSGAIADFSSGNSTPWKNYNAHITQAIICDGITHIGNSVFNMQSNLTAVFLGKDVASLGADVFSGANSMQQITLSAENPHLALVDHVLFNADKTLLIYSPAKATSASYSVPDTVVTIGDGAFIESANLSSITIPDSVTKIDRSAFARTGLTSITLPNSIKEIGRYAFFKTQAHTVNLGNGLTSWESNVFAGNSNLVNVTFAANFKTSGYSEAWGANIKNASLANMISTGTGAFTCPQLKNIEFGDHFEVAELPDFTVIKSLESVRFGKDTKIAAISAGAFKSLPNLKAITFDEKSSVGTIGDSAFIDCSNLKSFGGKNLRIGAVGAAAFARSGMTEIRLIGTTSVGLNAFLNCVNAVVADLTRANITVWGANNVFGGSNGQLADNAVIYFSDDASKSTLPSNNYRSAKTILAVTNGGTYGEETKFAAGTLETPSKEGYTFGGWYESSDFSGAAVTAAAANHTYYAQWTANAYTITFEGGAGAAGSMAELGAAYGRPTVLPANGFEKAGYDFMGWDRDAGADTVVYAEGAQVENLTAEAGGTVTLYAVWRAQTPTVPDTGLALDKTVLELAPGGTAKLKATLTPNDATYKYIFWTADKTDVATVSDSGLVTAVSEGTAVITAKSWYGHEAACTVTVKKAETPPPADPWPTEGLAGFVTRCYRVALGRDPDRTGHADWVRWLSDGTVDASSCAHGFVFSKEMNDKRLSDEAFVKTMYRLFLDREGEAEGVAFWTDYLKTGHGREEVFGGFADSVEFGRIKANFGIR